MDYFAGLDVSVKDTSVCIVDGTGKIAREVKVASEPAALLAVLTGSGPHSRWARAASILQRTTKRFEHLLITIARRD